MTDANRTELSLEDALALAIQLHRGGDLANAEIVYRRVLEQAPDYADAVHFYGVMLHHRDRSDEALTTLERSIMLDPTSGRYNNLGNALVERGRLDDAIDAYRQSIELEPGNADAYTNLGSLQQARGRLAESEAAFTRALELAPDHLAAITNMGNLRSVQGRFQEAIEWFWKAIGSGPRSAQSRLGLGFSYYALGQIEAAAEVFRLWSQTEPGNPIARHMSAACSGENVPSRASNEYIEQTFDGFAASFDAKLARLSYRAPELIAGAVARLEGAGTGNWSVLDAGCGTGLCGALIRAHARRMVGVDLSAQMLAAARVRGLYDELVKHELTDYIAGHTGVFDLIVSADTLCYFGSLDAVFEAAAHALTAAGHLVFTVEALEPGEAAIDHRIGPHGRFAHSEAYLRRAIGSAGLELVRAEPEDLRLENREPVRGFVVTARKG